MRSTAIALIILNNPLKICHQHGLGRCSSPLDNRWGVGWGRCRDVRVWMPGWGGGGFPWDSGHNMFSHGGKFLVVLINIKSFLVCQGMLGDVICGFRTCCMLLDTSWRTFWLVSVGSGRVIILLVFFLWEKWSELEVIHWECICYKKGDKFWIFWDHPRLIPASQKN